MKAKQVIDLFANVNGSTFISLTTCTRPALAGGKGNPQQGHIEKEIHGAQVMVFQHPAFERLVRRRLAAEGFPTDAVSTYQAGPRKWGTRQADSPIVLHEGKTYLELFVLRPGIAIYKLRGRPINEDGVIGLPDDSVYPVKIRCFNCDHVREITISGKTHKA